MENKAQYNLHFGQLPVSIYRTNQELGSASAEEAVGYIDAAIHEKGEANVIIATGNSQLTFLTALRTKQVDWSKVNIFHMDEYVGIDPKHPASFPLFLQKHIISYIHPKNFFPLQTQSGDLDEICRHYEALLRQYPVDVCALGIGENGHLAFNDPSYADFNDPVWVKVVRLADASLRQQVGEGHFANIQEVPTQAVTLTIPALLAARHVIANVPEARKAPAVLEAMTGPVQIQCPATILRQTPYAHVFLDLDSAAALLEHEGLHPAH